MKFATQITCMDGRIQLPVINYLKTRFGSEYIDTITEAGPVLYLAEGSETEIINSIMERVDISIDRHGSKSIAIVGHHDCARNPQPREVQARQIKQSIDLIKDKVNKEIEIIGLWVNENWEVEELNF